MGKKEKPVEDALIAAMQKRAAVVRKVTYQGRTGAPDRWALFPDGRWLLVEAKAPGEEPEPHQLQEMRALRQNGAFVAWIDSEEKAEQVVSDFNLFGRMVFNARWEL